MRKLFSLVLVVALMFTFNPNFVSAAAKQQTNANAATGYFSYNSWRAGGCAYGSAYNMFNPSTFNAYKDLTVSQAKDKLLADLKAYLNDCVSKGLITKAQADTAYKNASIRNSYMGYNLNGNILNPYKDKKIGEIRDLMLSDFKSSLDNAVSKVYITQAQADAQYESAVNGQFYGGYGCLGGNYPAPSNNSFRNGGSGNGWSRCCGW